jgi:Flp pilus assembly CpaF family ATPase
VTTNFLSVMNTPRNGAATGSILDSAEEEGGLSAVVGNGAQTLAREQAAGDTAVLQTVRDVLSAAFRERPQFLDPFAPAAERNAEVLMVLRAAIQEARQRGGPLARVPNDHETLLQLFAQTLGWGPAQRYLDDERVTEIKINDESIMVQEAGHGFVTVPERFNTKAEVKTRAILLASILGVRLDSEHPQETMPIAHGTRLHVTIYPRIPNPDGALICIRRGRREAWDLDDILSRGSINAEIAELLKLLVGARCAALIAGRTGSGKTGLLEALANTIPGEPHVITIEDHTLEIGIRRTSNWTRELVDASRDRRVFGSVAYQALRQTPDVVIPGETRAQEAGAILSVIMSDHAVMTTIHAKTPQEAVERFVTCATMPDSYMYEGRYDDALRDTCSGFDVVIKVDFWEAVGRRLVTEIALVDGTVRDGDRLRPNMIPLAKVDVRPDGEITWQMKARAVGGRLEWLEGSDRTPSQLRDKLLRARAQTAVRSTVGTTLDNAQDAIVRADRMLASNEAERAMNTLRNAWQQRRDERLMLAAQKALAQAPTMFAALIRESEMLRARLEQLVEQRNWIEARLAYEQLASDVARAAAAMPTGGWARLLQRVKTGLEREQQARAARTDAEAALAMGQARNALELLQPFNAAEMELSRPTLLTLLRVREQAMAVMVQRGEGAPAALETLRAQRDALEQALTVEQRGPQ